MGMYVSGSSAAGSDSAIKLTNSTVGIQIPSWAQFLLVSGSAGGGGGSGYNTASGHNGSAGGSGASAVRHTIPILPGAATFDVAIGTKGLAGALNGHATNGGNTIVTMLGVTVLRLNGGTGGRYIDNNVGGEGGTLGVALATDLLSIPNTDMATNVSYPGVVANMLETAVNFASRSLRPGTTGSGWFGPGVTTHISTANYAPTPFGGEPGVGYGFGGRRSQNPGSGGFDGGEGVLWYQFLGTL